MINEVFQNLLSFIVSGLTVFLDVINMEGKAVVMYNMHTHTCTIPWAKGLSHHSAEGLIIIVFTTITLTAMKSPPLADFTSSYHSC